VVGSGEDNNKDDTSTRRSERWLLLSRLTGVGRQIKGHTRERREWGHSCLALDEARCGGIYTQTETIQDEVCYA